MDDGKATRLCEAGKAPAREEVQDVSRVSVVPGLAQPSCRAGMVVGNFDHETPARLEEPAGIFDPKARVKAPLQRSASDDDVETGGRDARRRRLDRAVVDGCSGGLELGSLSFVPLAPD